MTGLRRYPAALLAAFAFWLAAEAVHIETHSLTDPGEHCATCVQLDSGHTTAAGSEPIKTTLAAAVRPVRATTAPFGATPRPYAARAPPL